MTELNFRRKYTKKYLADAQKIVIYDKDNFNENLIRFFVFKIKKS